MIEAATVKDSNTILNAIRERVARTVPNGWSLTTLGACFKWSSGGTPRRTEPAYFGGDIPWAVIGDLNDGVVADTENTINEAGLENSSAKWVEPGSILIAMYGSIGKLGIAGRRLTTNQAIAFTKPDPVDGKYLYYYLLWQRSSLARMGKGATQLNISQTVLKEFPFLLAPPDEQRRIVAEIEKQFSRLDEAVANLKRVKANLKRYKASVLKDAVEGRLVPTEAELARREGRSHETGSQLLQRILETRRCQWQGKGRYKAPAALDTTDLPELPEGWASVTIQQLLPPTREAMKTGPFGSLLKKHEHRSEGIAVLGIENIQAMRFVRGSKIHITRQKAHELEDYRVIPGDILLSRSWTVGEVCVVPNNIGDARMSTNLIKVSLAKEGMLPEFFMLLFNGSPFVLNQVSDLCKGSTRDFLNQEILKQLCFILPPLAEQHRIVAEVDRRLSLVRDVEAEVEANMKRSHGLKQAVLGREFSGETDALVEA